MPVPTVLLNVIVAAASLAAATAIAVLVLYVASPRFTPHRQSSGAEGLISPALQPQGYCIRALRASDFDRGLVDCLRALTVVGEIERKKFEERCRWRDRQDGYYTLVVEYLSDGKRRVVGTGSLVVERKFHHSLGLAAHIEDIAIAPTHQGRQLGKRLVQALESIAQRVGCYKSMLDCSEANEGFYEKCGFRRGAVQMASYYDGRWRRPWDE